MQLGKEFFFWQLHGLHKCVIES